MSASWLPGRVESLSGHDGTSSPSGVNRRQASGGVDRHPVAVPPERRGLLEVGTIDIEHRRKMKEKRFS